MDAVMFWRALLAIVIGLVAFSLGLAIGCSRKSAKRPQEWRKIVVNWRHCDKKPKILKIRVDELRAYESTGEYAFKGAEGELCVVHSDNILAIRDAEESDD